MSTAESLHEALHAPAQLNLNQIAHGETAATRDAVTDMERLGEQLHATLN